MYKPTKLWHIRQCLGVTPEEIVRYANISRSHYQAIELGRRRPSIDTANEILYGLNRLLSSTKKRHLRKAGFFVDKQQKFMLLDLDLTLYRRGNQ